MGNRRVFGTDGVRGRANQTPMDSEMALRLGRSMATYLRQEGKRRNRIVIGKDTRLSGYMLETALASGIVSAGTDVMLVGPLPTPGVAFISRSMRADAGIVITGSHNDYRDNGIKFFDRSGFKLDEDIERKLEELVITKKMNEGRVTAEKLGKAFRIKDAAGRYIQFLKSGIGPEKTLDGLTIVLDCSNGAAYDVAPTVFEELGAEVIILGNEPDGTNINVNCGSLHPENMCSMVKSFGAHCGIALDGDADRVIMCDEKGKVVDGDVILALTALHWKEQGRLKSSGVVATVMSNMALDNTLKQSGIDVIRTQVGDRYVVKAMHQEGYNIGGEQSGHLIFLDYNTTGDGVLGALQVLEIMLKTGKPISELRNVFTPYPQVLRNILVREKEDFTEIGSIQKAIAAAERELGGEGRVLVRYSGTEKIARIMVEGKSEKRIEKLADTIADSFREELGV